MAEHKETDDIKLAMADTLLDDLLKERRTERRWRLFRRTALSILTFTMGLLFYAKQPALLGQKDLPDTDVVGVINLTGEIGAGKAASADKIIPLLEKAFDSPNVKAIYLNIDSPGGSPVESERINAVLNVHREKTGKPVYAVINTIGASAAYMVAAHTDKIYAARYSLVGSIGAIMQGWDFHRAINDYKVNQRTYASGNLKGLMNPFSPMPDGGAEKAQTLVNQMGQEFAREVKSLRGTKLSRDEKDNLFSGEVWNGIESVRLGLVDEIGTLDQVILKSHNIKSFDFGPRPSRYSVFGVEMLSEVFVGAIQSALQTINSTNHSFVEMKALSSSR